MKFITKLNLKNFRRFRKFSVDFDAKLNILVGDNESGKSSIIEAINLVLSGSRSKVESVGLENIFNSKTIKRFLASDKKYEALPTLFVELYFNEQNNPDLNGRNNSEGIICDGLKLEIIPNDDLSKDIQEILKQAEPVFPFEFYTIKFSTFSGEAYSGYRKFLKHILVDNSQISSEYAIKEYVKDMYGAFANSVEQNNNQNEYRKHKESFKNNILKDLNARVPDYDFSIRSNSKANLETDLTLTEDDISIENKGKGIQCFIKTEFALSRTQSNLDVILLEEPENHLSHINMKKLIRKISAASEKQIFISTHNNLISTRLNLRNSILLNSNSSIPVLLRDIDETTSKFFIKAPDNNILEFVLSKKVILVEGDAEYILMETFFNNVKKTTLELSDVHIISVDGTSFKRYLKIAEVLNIKTAVIRDNDGDYKSNCVDNFKHFEKFDFIKVFSEEDPKLSTFEISLYNENQGICDELFLPGRVKLSVLEYMLKNKAEVAFQLLDKKADSIIAPKYIKTAIKWISE
ncbi:MAG: ATP-dependent endonuclease [Bacteroidetes bacterium GWC2_33_15]|nr:MAG: ATP-dependent endonuclease [Bacteroidetes bacterium GWA2_33_15]OFX49251.1 MAG: ATP-dependent endonuclease [Bacteroidetes bacterium GWC2_33_15]OFX65407.1 MAG: ATP-dependent endonuclease [Bacteroidetes bacterium GWB2_32_14]OFX69595.1 MAG: ATP-dependent endonuclease [Bacteroidetes bacterium GWD2_33_33]HAN17493.1 ATP-dependent endonuclease [Bacteroidales bacterium]